jgi:hypothetical protein
MSDTIQSAELELASIAFNSRMNTPDGYAKMISEFRTLIKVRDAAIRADEARKQAERYALRVALKPFAEMAKQIGESRPSIQTESDVVYGFENSVLTLGDFHRATKALADLEAPK